MNICPIYEASLSHHTLWMGNLVWFYYMYTVCISLIGTHVKITTKKKCVTAPILKLTSMYDQKPETFWGPTVSVFKLNDSNRQIKKVELVRTVSEKHLGETDFIDMMSSPE